MSNKIVDITGLGRFFENIKTYISGLLKTKQDLITDLDEAQKTAIRDSLNVPSNEQLNAIINELRQLIENNKFEETITILDKAILDMHKLG